MKKLLSNTSLKNRTLRIRSDLSQFEKTAIHRYHQQGESTWLKWYNMLTRNEQIEVQQIFKIDDGFILKQRERNNL